MDPAAMATALWAAQQPLLVRCPRASLTCRTCARACMLCCPAKTLQQDKTGVLHLWAGRQVLVAQGTCLQSRLQLQSHPRFALPAEVSTPAQTQHYVACAGQLNWLSTNAHLQVAVRRGYDDL